MLYGDWLNEWLAYFVKPTVRARTYDKYRAQAERHILPALGGCDMDELSALKLQRFTTELVERGYASNTVNGIVSTLKASLKRAAALGLAACDHSDAIVRPKAREKGVECFDRAEQRMLERYIASRKNDRLFGIVLCLYMGFRIGELLALEWRDVDLKGGVITVSRSCRDGWENGRYVKMTESPKTASGNRRVPIPKTLLPRLKELKSKTACEYVVCGRTEYGAEVRSYQRTFETTLKKLGLKKRGFHALRHTFATRALEVGVDVKTLSELLGHSSPAVTLKRYAHSLSEHKRDMMNKIGKLLL